MAKKKSRSKGPFCWTEPRKEVAALVAQGKSFMEIVADGYSKTMASLVMNALKHGANPEEPTEGEVSEQHNQDGEVPGQDGEGKKETKDGETSAKGRPLIATASPKTSPIIFKLGLKEIVLDPLELHNQYRYYLDLSKRNGGISETFSEVLTLGMQVLWVLHQDIPMTENMLKAVFSK